jgi:hypothetical protein
MLMTCSKHHIAASWSTVDLIAVKSKLSVKTKTLFTFGSWPISLPSKLFTTGASYKEVRDKHCASQDTMSTPVRSAPTPVRSANPLVFSALRSPGSKHKALGKIEREVLGKKDVNCEQPAARAMPPPAPRTATKKAAPALPPRPLRHVNHR